MATYKSGQGTRRIVSVILSFQKRFPEYPLCAMAADAEHKTPRRDSVIGMINSPDGIADVVRGFRAASKGSNSEQGFQGLAELVDRVPKLEADILEKERALKWAQETSEREREVHRRKQS